jgi:glycosyltransferase involved in cell wall biosynthesis
VAAGLSPGPPGAGAAGEMGAAGVAGVAAQVASPAYEGDPPPDVSVVVATYARPRALGALVGALAVQTMDPRRFEVMVVDDGSPDDTWDELTALAAATPIRLLGLRLEANQGQGPARNAGVARARAEVLAFTDDDCLPAPGWLEALTSPLVGSGPGVVVQGVTRPPGGGAGMGPWDRALWVLRPSWLFETCNIAYHRRDFSAAGGFPGRGQVPSTPTGKLVGEDAVLGWRVAEGGARLLFEAEAVVHHPAEAATFREWLAAQRGKAVFPDLAGRSPYARRALWGRWFLAPRTAAFDLAVVTTTAALIGRRAGRSRLAPRMVVLAVLPWVWLALPEAAAKRGRHPALRLAQLAAGDLVGLVALAGASIRSRRVVL